MESTPTSMPNYKKLFPASEIKAIRIPHKPKCDASTNTDFISTMAIAPSDATPVDKNTVAAQRSPPSLTSPVGAFVLTPHPKKGYRAVRSIAAESESVLPQESLMQSKDARQVKAAAGKLPQKIGPGTKKIDAAAVTVRKGIDVKPQGPVTTPTQPVTYRKRILDTFDLKKKYEEGQGKGLAAPRAAPVPDRGCLTSPLRAAALITSSDPVSAPAPEDQIRSPTNVNQRLRLRAAAGVRPAPPVPRNIRLREIDSAARIAAAEAAAVPPATPAATTATATAVAAASVTVSPTTITGSPPSAPVPAAVLASARAVQVRKISHTAPPVSTVGVGTSKLAVRRSSLPATLASATPAQARVVMGGGKGRPPAQAPAVDPAVVASSAVPAQEEATPLAVEEPPTISTTAFAPGSVCEAMLLGLQSPTMGARRRQSYPAAESTTKTAQQSATAGECTFPCTFRNVEINLPSSF